MAEKKQKPAGKQETPEAGKKVHETEPWSILMHPHLAEKSMKMVEAENKLVFMVKRNANKGQIKEAIESAFGVKVTKVNFEITMQGQKKAYVKLRPEFSASDIATRMGMI
jgi:large subunit ribosomal protein L23